jgi:hypothetical protein
MELKRKTLIASALLLNVVMLTECRSERPTQVIIEGAGVPTFHLSGSGKLASFSVYLVPPVPEQMTKPFSDQVPIWQITAEPDPLHGRPVEDIQKLSYGAIPAGYKQGFPENGSLPPVIAVEKDYFFDCTTTDAPTESGFFRVHDGKAISAKVKTPCWTTKNNKWVAVPCGR